MRGCCKVCRSAGNTAPIAVVPDDAIDAMDVIASAAGRMAFANEATAAVSRAPLAAAAARAAGAARLGRESVGRAVAVGEEAEAGGVMRESMGASHFTPKPIPDVTPATYSRIVFGNSGPDLRVFI